MMLPPFQRCFLLHFLLGKKRIVATPKTDMTTEKQPFEDVSDTFHSWLFLGCHSFLFGDFSMGENNTKVRAWNPPDP